MISAILSSFNERHNDVFWDNFVRLRSYAQTIVVDGGSHDGTLERLVSLGADIFFLPESHRAARFNLGIRQARGDVILLVHPRTLVPQDALAHLQSLDGRSRVWGAFTHAFDESHGLLKFTSWYSNRVRGDMRGVYYLDHGLFFTSALRAAAVFPDVELFEDTYFCRKLREVAKPVRLPYRAVTSAIRFRRNGVWRQSLMNQAMKVFFFLGVSEKWMNRIYERGLSLNIRQS